MYVHVHVSCFILAYTEYESGRYSPKLFKTMDVEEVKTFMYNVHVHVHVHHICIL